MIFPFFFLMWDEQVAGMMTTVNNTSLNTGDFYILTIKE